MVDVVDGLLSIVLHRHQLLAESFPAVRCFILIAAKNTIKDTKGIL